MNEDIINDIMEYLEKMNYECRDVFGELYKTENVLNKEQLNKIEYGIRTVLSKYEIPYNAELEAKILVYEEIIKKSNFAPLIDDGKKR